MNELRVIVTIQYGLVEIEVPEGVVVEVIDLDLEERIIWTYDDTYEEKYVQDKVS